MATLPKSEPEYETEFTGTGAPKNLHLNIEVGKAGATIHSGAEEHVGDHKHRRVTFLADRDCILKFDGDRIFETSEQKLKAGHEKTLFIKDDVKRGDVYCVVTPIDSTRRSPTTHHSPPKIVVP
jgi:hypothetical protein